MEEKLKGASSTYASQQQSQYYYETSDPKTVLLATKEFKEKPNSSQCQIILTKIACLLSMGHKFTEDESTELFFAITRLFQSKRLRIRRMIYLILKNLRLAADGFIVVSSLSKDMNGKNEEFKANALRALGRIVDATIASQLERNFKNAFVDRPFVASSGLLCGLRLIQAAPDVVRRWTNEISQCLNTTTSPMVQFHALLLLVAIKKNDIVACHKIFLSQTAGVGHTSKSPLVECLLIRMAKDFLLSSFVDPLVQKASLDYIEQSIKSHSEIVVLDAAKAFVELAGAKDRLSVRIDFVPAIISLQIFLASPKPVVRYAAVKSINLLSKVDPKLVIRCTQDLEPLVNDSNKNIATLALITILKTCHDTQVEKYIKDIQGLLKDTTDSSRIEIIQAVRILCESYPSKHHFLCDFLSRNLQKEASMEFKSEVVKTLIYLSNQGENGLLQLCEFIEDCEYTNICCNILTFLAQKIPLTQTPSKYIRFVYNRLILEKAPVRAEAAHCLCKIAIACPDMAGDIAVLLRRCLHDSDDEVRDRAASYLSPLKKFVEKENNIKADVRTTDLLSMGGDKKCDEDASTECSLDDILEASLGISIDALCTKIDTLLEGDISENLNVFANLPTEEEYAAQEAVNETQKISETQPGHSMFAVDGSTEEASSVESFLCGSISSIVPMHDLGPLLHSVRKRPLTEREAEYSVFLTKHVFEKHLVLELEVLNTMAQQALQDVSASIDAPTTWSVLGVTTIPNLGPQISQSIFVVVLPTEESIKGEFSLVLTFTVIEIPGNVSYPEEYPLAAFQIEPGDFLSSNPLRPTEFGHLWDRMEATTTTDTFQMPLKFDSVASAVPYLLGALNLAPCDETENCSPGKTNHQLLLSGATKNGTLLLVKIKVAFSPVRNVTGMKVEMRCTNKEGYKIVKETFVGEN
eukprot:GHVP01050564.1.p1 GENE.GHVP01050564.1~~GHVP01050564.1.p1  ORF type:complete len:921 (-),score=175.84 GHVP01050564.1:2194-4956(-)